MAIDKTLYNEESIESLSPLEFTHLRSGIYVGERQKDDLVIKSIKINTQHFNTN